MTTAVASPPNFQSLPRISWNGTHNNQGGFSAMSTEEVSRMFIPQRKVVSRSSSSSSLASNNSSTSTTTITQTTENNGQNGTESNTSTKKKQPRGGFWPVSKAESTSSVTNTRVNGAVQPTNSNNTNVLNTKNGLQPTAAGQNGIVTNVGRAANGAVSEASALLVLLPMNGTFERKQIHVPFYPDMLRIGRQTNAKTVPTPSNGFFDSKVLSRQHAEIWAEKNGKIWIRDVKSSNGTFVNGARLSQENRESEPHELRQHDSLELGIDIVSEDQKTIVHHKVSAKVEFAGLPGNSSNVLDLNFGDLDPSHGNSILASPLSAPMVHSRGHPGRPMNGRGSVASSVAGSHVNSMIQRQANYWGTPLNIEQLVKQVSIEMKAARQQTLDLEQTNTYLHSMVTADGSQSKAEAAKENPQPPRPNSGRIKAPRLDPATRFADPPAPPPQQPLPEKPDSAKANSPSSTSLAGVLKRENTAKPPSISANSSPTSTQSSQILSLVEALSVAKKELDSQGARMKQLEDMLKQERLAREAAEDRAKKLEETASAREIITVAEDSTAPIDNQVIETEPEAETKSDEDSMALQQKYELMVAEMQRMRSDLESVTQRADSAEDDANNARMSLAEMIEKFQKEALESTEKASEETSKGAETQDNILSKTEPNMMAFKDRKHANGHVRSPKLPEHLEQAVATILKESQSNGDTTAQSAPYISMLGVVLIGVGLMAYLNSWQKVDK